MVFGIGLIPLSITSQSLLTSMTMFGTGRLIFSGIVTFLGSIVFGAVTSAFSVPEVSASSFRPAAVAITHVAGVLVMFIAERRLSSRMLHTSPSCGLDSETPSSPTIATQHDTELKETERTDGLVAQVLSASRTARLGVFGPHQRRVYLFIFAFVAVEIADGISAGYLAMAPPGNPHIGRDDQSDQPMPPLSSPKMLHYLILSLFGKGATTLAFVTTLLSASLPIAECKRHVLLYAAARPLATLLSYAVTVLSGITPTNDRPYIVAMNCFMDGLLVYAELVLRALIINSRGTSRSSLLTRVFLLAAGAFLPSTMLILAFIGHMWYTGRLSSDTVEVV
ncbi:hypothetical protein GSI_06909 [Ganoderma sinense ZZ0214-1]|uniref:Transporter n=1 Tax=Ganoderma sinense ZZ0214-1 TaxID=1077348 RepID=A0A2G8SAG6_9APHY|nr:hypothetical protein GSI_06909 [Ganoderma sinense ZZ0214-1]